MLVLFVWVHVCLCPMLSVNFPGCELKKSILSYLKSIKWMEKERKGGGELRGIMGEQKQTNKCRPTLKLILILPLPQCLGC